jgi:uncharacterized protein DUF955
MIVRGFDPRPVASGFWARVGRTEEFPRQLRGPIASTLPVAVISLPRLTLSAAASWLERRGATSFGYGSDRAIRGVLVAQRGHGFIFLDGTMEPDEERLTLAHETAHFLHHYQNPRLSAIGALGPEILPVLDGDRTPTVAEDFSSVLKGVALGCYQNALERPGNGLLGPRALQLETQADLIALQLLAPCDRVASTTEPGQSCRDALCREYRLTLNAATAWGAWIDARRAPDALIARLEDYRRRK